MDIYEKLEKLKSLLDSGAITQEEYNGMKKQALESDDSATETSQNPISPTAQPDSLKEKCELIHALGIGAIVVEMLLIMIAMLVGWFSSIKAQYIMCFVACLLGILYIPCGLIYALKKNRTIDWIVVSLLLLIVIFTMVWGIVTFANFAKYF